MSAEEQAGVEPIVNAVAGVSLAAGVLLLAAPSVAGKVLGVDCGPRMLRTIGLVDLALAPGLYFGRSKSTWMTARALSNPLIAAVTVAKARSKRAKVVAAGLCGATVMDLRTASRLRTAGV